MFNYNKTLPSRSQYQSAGDMRVPSLDSDALALKSQTTIFLWVFYAKPVTNIA